MSSHLFVYGTLRSDCGAVYGALLDTHFVLCGSARVRGELFEIAGYPGLHASEVENAGWVIGELYRLTGSFSAFDVLDDYEGCSPRHASPHEYSRRVLPVQFGEEVVEAYVYCYEGEVDPGKYIASGDYREFLKNQKIRVSPASR